MKLRGNDRLRMLLMGAAAWGVFGAHPSTWADEKMPVPTTSKKPAAKPAVIQPPALLPVPGDLLPAKTDRVIIPVAQVQNAPRQKTKVQLELEQLYAQDGREMPEMDMSIKPVPMSGTPDNPGTPATPATPAAPPGNTSSGIRTQQPPYRPTQPQASLPQPFPPPLPPATPVPATPAPSTHPSTKPATSRPVVSFFKKMLPGGKDKPTKPSNDYRPDVAPQPPDTGSITQTYPPALLNNSNLPTALNTSPPTVKPVGMVSSLPPLDGQPRMPFVPSITTMTSKSDFPPAPGASAMPELSGAALPPLISLASPPLSATPSSSIPSSPSIPLATIPESPSVAAATVKSVSKHEIPVALPSSPPLTAADAISISPAASEVSIPGDVPPARSDLNNPFTEMSEAEADSRLEPFTGLTLDENEAAYSSKPIVNDSGRGTKDSAMTGSSEDPFAEELRKMGVLPPIGTESKQEPAKQTPAAQLPTTQPLEQPAAAAQPSVARLSPSDSPTFDGMEDEISREKMRRIHERGSMKGLKGFCPVTLRDRRELVDAKPEFHSTYRGQKFHFTDADSKLKFDEDPARYAPAAYGADVVALTRDKDVVEGTLDYAAWFKGRLYLFGTQNAHDAFVADPALYATPVGIE